MTPPGVGRTMQLLLHRSSLRLSPAAAVFGRRPPPPPPTTSAPPSRNFVVATSTSASSPPPSTGDLTRAGGGGGGATAAGQQHRRHHHHHHHHCNHHHHRPHRWQGAPRSTTSGVRRTLTSRSRRPSPLSQSSRPAAAVPQSDLAARPTLFGLPDLVHPSDFAKLARGAMEECDAIRRELASSLSSSSSSSSPSDNNDHSSSDASSDDDSDAVRAARRTLHMLDDISNVVCSVIDAAELCRSVHADPRWRRGASDAFGILSEYIGSLNADENLYRSLRRFVFVDDGGGSGSGNGNVGEDDGGPKNGRTHHPTILSRLPAEYQRMANAMRREFERDGIHLQYTQREEARELNNVVVGLESLFASNITEKTKYYDVVGDDMVGEVDRIVPRHVLGQLVRNNGGAPQGGASATTTDRADRLTLSSDNLLSNTLLAHSPSPALRREVYLQSHTSVPENLGVLDSLVRHRHMHSVLLGYRSYAHRVLSDRMVGSPEKVCEFLSAMEDRSREVFRKDMEAMSHAKRKVEGGVCGEIEPWDVPFYTTLIKAQRQHRRWMEDGGGSDGGEGYDEDESSQFAGYFSVENSIGGMKVLVRELFGITMEEAAIPAEERWDLDDAAASGGAAAAAAGGGLRKFEFRHDKEGPLGTMYFDLHPRDGKFVHAAHFTIRCGRIRTDDDDDDGGHQLPIVALVCNLSPSSSPDSDASTLSHSEVETLYHEFGHGLHSLLSRTSFQHLSGTRAAMDFVETPSHLFETFARDPSFLSRVLARHRVTGLPMSERRARHLAMSHADFRGIEIQTQIVHSRFDQALFGERPCSPSLGGSDSTEAFGRLHAEAGVPYAPGTHWHSRFGHLVTYGAGYYGYLYAQTFAADIWSSTNALASSRSALAGGAPDAAREGGTKIWKEMLVHGGAKDPRDMICAVLGREPSVDPFFEGMS